VFGRKGKRKGGKGQALAVGIILGGHDSLIETTIYLYYYT